MASRHKGVSVATLPAGDICAAACSLEYMRSRWGSIVDLSRMITATSDGGQKITGPARGQLRCRRSRVQIASGSGDPLGSLTDHAPRYITSFITGVLFSNGGRKDYSDGNLHKTRITSVRSRRRISAAAPAHHTTKRIGDPYCAHARSATCVPLAADTKCGMHPHGRSSHHRDRRLRRGCETGGALHDNLCSRACRWEGMMARRLLPDGARISGGSSTSPRIRIDTRIPMRSFCSTRVFFFPKSRAATSSSGTPGPWSGGGGGPFQQRNLCSGVHGRLDEGSLGLHRQPLETAYRLCR